MAQASLQRALMTSPPLDRRRFVSLTTSGLAVFAAEPAGAVSTALVRRHRRLSIRVVEGPGGSLRRAALAQLGRELAVATDEQLTFHADGQADGWIGSAHDLADFNPAFGYFAGLPCLSPIHAQAVAEWMRLEGGRLMMKLGGEHGLACFPVNAARRRGLSARRRIEGAADLYGKRIATRGLMRDVYRALGAFVEPPDCSSTAMTVVDLFDIAPSVAAKVGSTFTDYDLLAPAIETTALVLSRDAWIHLDAPAQAAIATVAQRAFARSLATQLRDLAPLSEAPPADLLAAMHAICSAHLADIATRDVLVNTIDRSYRRALCS